MEKITNTFTHEYQTGRGARRPYPAERMYDDPGKQNRCRDLVTDK